MRHSGSSSQSLGRVATLRFPHGSASGKVARTLILEPAPKRAVRERLHIWIFTGMALGAILGLLLWGVDREAALFRHTVWTLDLVGKTLFIGALKMLVPPLIFATIVAGVTSLPSARDLGDLGWKTFAYYLATTSIAVFIGIVAVTTIQPGKWEASRKITAARQAELAGEASAAVHDADTAARYHRIQERKRTPAGFVGDILDEMIQNPFRALASGSSLGIIFFALLLGVSCLAVGREAEPAVQFFRALNTVVLKLTIWIMAFSPVAVFALMAGLLAQQGPDVFHSLAGYIVTVIGGIGVHVIILLLICKYAGRMSPLRLLRGIREAWLIAFSTRSSAATLPVTLRCAEENLGISRKVTEFVLPVGATLNMDGTALYEGVAIIFLIQMFGGMPDVGITLEPLALLLIFLAAVLASVGAAAVPDAGLITMVLVAGVVGLPEYYLVYIFAVDAFLDMFRTSTNVMGDTVGAVVMQRIEGGRLKIAA